MLLPRIYAPARAAFRASKPSRCSAGSGSTLEIVRTSPAAVTSPILTFVRYATHQSEGRANGSKDGPGKRLGAKKTAEEYVIPGNIIFRQRGTKWYPGENCDMGRDHTIFSLVHGYVKYYKDPINHPKRQFIGVTFERDDKLPYPPNAPRKRRVGMRAVPRDAPDSDEVALGEEVVGGRVPVKKVRRRDYQNRVTNWEIGRTAETAGVKVRQWVKGDRFLAWRKRTARVARMAEKRTMRAAVTKGKGGDKSKGKGKAKGGRRR